MVYIMLNIFVAMVLVSYARVRKHFKNEFIENIILMWRDMREKVLCVAAARVRDSDYRFVRIAFVESAHDSLALRLRLTCSAPIKAHLYCTD